MEVEDVTSEVAKKNWVQLVNTFWEGPDARQELRRSPLLLHRTAVNEPRLKYKASIVNIRTICAFIFTSHSH